MMNSGISAGADYPVDYARPSDLIAIERRLSPKEGHESWRIIEGYFLTISLNSRTRQTQAEATYAPAPIRTNKGNRMMLRNSTRWN